MKSKLEGYFLRKKNSPACELSSTDYIIDTNGLKIVSNQAFKKIKYYQVLICNGIFETYTEDYSLNNYENKHEELVVELYEKYGSEFCHLLDGNFLIIIYNLKTNTISFFNNRYQATSLYYYLNDDIFLFANSIKPLLNNIPSKIEFDINSIPSFLNTGFSSTEKTQIKNIFRLLPTYTLIINSETFNLKNHWNKEFIFKRASFPNLEEKLDEYENIFKKNIKNFLNYSKTKRLGCFLSGGHDTAFTFIQASKIFKEPIHTFTASFENFGFDEAPKAKYVNDQFNGKHHIVTVGPKDLDLIPQMIRSCEEPVSGGSLGIYACAKEASKYVDTILTGDAGDTLWGEYYPIAEWHNYFKYIPHTLRKLIYGLNKNMAKFTNWERLWESEHVFSLFQQKNIYENFFERLCTYRHFNDTLLKEILNTKLFPKINYNKCILNIPCAKDNFYDYLIESKMFYGVHQYMLPPTQKPLTDLNVNFFSPYLNHQLINFINSLPQEWLNSGSTFKKLINDADRRRFHKQALLRYFPTRFIYSMQQSMDIPFHGLFKERTTILDALLVRLQKRNWYNNQALSKIFEEFPKQKVKPHEICELNHHGYRIYALLTFEVWCMEFLDKKSQPDKVSKDTIIPLEQYLSAT